MKGLRLVAFALVTFLALGVASVYANSADGNLGLPILGTTGAPALASPSLYSGTISVLYAEGTPVVLEANTVALDLCSSNSCTSVTATLKQTSPGTYTYSFTPPSLTGTITIYIKAYALADDNGRIFPSVDTSIGSYAYTPSPASSVPPAAAGTPVPQLTSQAVNTSPTQTTQPAVQASPIEPLLLLLAALSVAGSLLVVSKRR